VGNKTKYHAADTVLVYDEDQYDGMVYSSTLTLFILERGRLTQADARKAIDSVMGVRSVVVNRYKVEIHMSRPDIRSHDDARAVAADFAEMLEAAFLTRDRQAANAQAQAATVQDGYRNDPPHRR
jgi:hypothetical protein